MSSERFHGKTIEEIVEIRFKEWEIRQAKEREEREALKRAIEANKADITQPAQPPAAAPAPNHPTFVAVKNWLHKHHWM
jgi:hypothetical protein